MTRLLVGCTAPTSAGSSEASATSPEDAFTSVALPPRRLDRLLRAIRALALRWQADEATNLRLRQALSKAGA